MYIEKRYVVDAVKFDSKVLPENYPKDVKEENGKYVLSYNNVISAQLTKIRINDGDWVVNDGSKKYVMTDQEFQLKYAEMV